MATGPGKQPPYHPEPPPPYSATTSTPIGFQTVSYGQNPGTSTVYVQQQGSTHVVTTQPVVQPVMIYAGASCPACRQGVLRSEVTCCGIFLAIFFFPIGILCCFLMMERRCTTCHLTFA
ncbi:hypothetical protein SK128_006376 [Halocaridina rubra]|uniref:Membrane protein BRI3 n=1 Tax=Halocaridina rubra TaxID=373956 RepID=A0AAN9A7E5_HALRR